MGAHGLHRFKSWPTADFWFYPRYGNKFSNAAITKTISDAKAAHPNANPRWVWRALNGWFQATRDFDVLRLAWNHDN